MFGYRNLGFGSHPNRTTVVIPITWESTVTTGYANDKVAFWWYGFDTSTPGASAAIGSVGDSTIDGMVGSNGSSEVSIISCVWSNFNNQRYVFGITLVENGTPNPGQTGWVSFTCNSVTFLRSAASFNVSRKAAGYGALPDYDNIYAYTWNIASGGNPFGSTGVVTVDVSMSNE